MFYDALECPQNTQREIYVLTTRYRILVVVSINDWFCWALIHKTLFYPLLFFLFHLEYEFVRLVGLQEDGR